MGVALKVEAFGGTLPAIDDRLLPNDAATVSDNTYLYSGRLEGTPKPKLIHTLSDPSAAAAFRIPNNFVDSAHLSDSTWLEFDDPNTNVLRTNVVQDAYQRYYWASSSAAPMYNTLDRIQNGDNPLILGVPTPANAPTVSVSGGSGVQEARAYVYTWVTEFGEEGPPSPPTLVNGFLDGTWNITLTAPATTDVDGTDRLIANVNIYRTVTGSDGTTTYFFVTQLDIATTTYADTIDDTVVAINNELPSTTWTGPPSNLLGWVAMPNGMIAGWDDEDNLWFCEPYRPHAWPVNYVDTVQYPIVGLGVVGQTLIVCTESFPYWATGVNPSVISLTMIQALEPCIARGGILSAPEGVYYPSPNGLILANANSARNITRTMILKENWLNMPPVRTLRAARLGVGYYAWGAALQGVFEPTAFETTAFEQEDFTGSLNGLLIDPTDQRVAVSSLSNSGPAFNVMNDVWTGEVFVIRNGGVYWIDISDDDPGFETYKWRSRVFQAPTKRNLEAMKVWFTVSDTAPAISTSPPSRALDQTFDPNTQYALIRVYADGEHVLTRELRQSGKQMRLLSGFKADYWQIEIEGQVSIYKIAVAESAKELAKV